MPVNTPRVPRRCGVADIWPLVRSVASSGLRSGPLPEKLLGELQDFSLTADVVPGKPLSWQARATLRDLGLEMPAPGWALAGVSGKLQANEQGGQIEVDADEGLLRLPWLFRADLRTTRTEGIFAWKSVPAGLQLYTDDLRISNAEIETRTRLSVTLPPSGSPFVDVKARVVGLVGTRCRQPSAAGAVQQAAGGLARPVDHHRTGATG